MLEISVQVPCTPRAMVGFRKLTISTCALLALVALKIYIDMTYTFPFDAARQPAASRSPGNLVAVLEALQGQDNRSTAKLHSLAQRLRKTVVASDALWNRKELQLLDSKGLTAWTCRSDKDSIKDAAAYPHALQHFLLHGGCRNHPTLIDQPSKCSPNKTFLLLAIKSSPQNFAQRQAVRNSWGSERDYDGRPVRLVFLLGVAPGPDLSPLLSYENGRFHDLLQWDFMDTFFNLTVKDQMFLGWARVRCPGATYILKGDDDVFVRTPDVVRQLSSMTGQKPRALYMGDVVMAANPYRDPRSKYYIPPSYYVGSYPPYAGGGGYVFSGVLVPWLYLVSQFVAPFPIDDVYVGMCFMALGVSPVGNPRFRTFETPGGREVLKCPKQRLLLVHRKSPQEMLKLWGQLTDNVAQC